MANICENYIRIAAPLALFDDLLEDLEGPSNHWWLMGDYFHSDRSPASAHEAARCLTMRAKATEAYRLEGMPEWMVLGDQDILFWLDENQDLVNHPSLRAAPISFPKLFPWGGAEAYDLARRDIRAYEANLYGRLPEFHLARRSEGAFSDFSHCGDMMPNNPFGSDEIGVLDALADTKWAPPNNPMTLIRDALARHRAEGVWAWIEIGNGFWGYEAFTGGQILTGGGDIVLDDEEEDGDVSSVALLQEKLSAEDIPGLLAGIDLS